MRRQDFNPTKLVYSMIVQLTFLVHAPPAKITWMELANELDILAELSPRDS